MCHFVVRFSKFSSPQTATVSRPLDWRSAAPVCVLVVLEVLMAWQLCRAFNCRILYGHYLPTVILTIIWYSITHSLFHSRLKTFLFCKSFPLQPFPFLLRDSLHGFPRLFTAISEHICFVLLVFLLLHFLVVGSVR